MCRFSGAPNLCRDAYSPNPDAPSAPVLWTIAYVLCGRCGWNQALGAKMKRGPHPGTVIIDDEIAHTASVG